ncbi:hypothetical protein Tco_0816442 [Tanacetum coccineum]
MLKNNLSAIRRTTLLKRKFLHFLRDSSWSHSGEIKMITDVNVNKLHQPWRSFAAVINKCLSGKSTGYDSLRLSQAQILWGMYHKKNVDYAYLLWEDFVYQVENKNVKRSNEIMILSAVWVAILPIDLTNEAIKDLESYKEYYAIASGAEPPKTKASVKKKQVESDKAKTPPATKGKRLKTTAKVTKPSMKKQPTQGLETLSEVALTEEEQMRIVTKRSLTEYHSSHASGSGADEGTGVTPGVPDVPKYGSDDEQISWKSSFDEDDDAESENDNDNDDADNQDDDGHEYDEHDDEEQGDDDAQTDSDNDDTEMTDAPRTIIQTTQVTEDTHVIITAPVNPEDQPDKETSQHPDWFQKPTRPPSLDCDWNKTLPDAHGPVQPWISSLDQMKDPHESFNELIDTPLDFSAFVMNRLKVDTLTPELLTGPTFELMKGSCKSLALLIPNSRGRRVIPFDHFINNDLEYLSGGVSSRKYTTSVTKTKAADYGHIKWIEDLVPNRMWSQVPVSYDKHALWGISHWGRKRQQFYGFAVNRESARDVYSKRRIIAVTKLEIVEWHNYKHLDWITVRRDCTSWHKPNREISKRLYAIQDIEDMLLLLVQGKLTNLTVEERIAFNVSLRMFTRSIVIQRRVEDLQLGVESYQKKLNLTKPDTYRSDLKRREAYSAYSNPRGFIYQNKDKKNRLMRIDELHKFSDGTLNDVRTALNDRLKGIQMKYLPQTIWRQSDRDKAGAMIQAIDKQLKTRRIMRSLEKFVGGRPYEDKMDSMHSTLSMYYDYDAHVKGELLNIRVISFTMKMEILLEPTSNKLMVEHAEFDESDTHVLERFDTSAGNPVKEILLKLNLPDHSDPHGFEGYLRDWR